jgi:molybdate transport system substrate-binding protein
MHSGLSFARRTLCAIGVAVSVAAAALGLGAASARAVELRVLAAGAVEATVHDMVGQFEKQTGHTVKLSYGAVGALRDKIYAGEPTDLTIVTPAILEQLVAKGLVRPETRMDLGKVGGGIAVRQGAPVPPIGNAEELKRALLAAEHVYYADPATATAGAYFIKVADSLGVGAEVRKKGRVAPGGKEAMKMMAEDTGTAIGLTQASEIVAVPAVKLIGPYPGALQSSTIYTGVVMKQTDRAAAAEAFLKFLMSEPVQARFHRGGFEPAH